jgi:hypothetical protein
VQGEGWPGGGRQGEGGAATQGEDKSEVLDPVAVSDLVPIVLVVLLRWPFQRSLLWSRQGWEKGHPSPACSWCLSQRCPRWLAMGMLARGGRRISLVGDGVVGGSCASFGADDVVGRRLPRCPVRCRPAQAGLVGLAASRNLQQAVPLSESGVVSVCLVGNDA